PVRGRGVGFWPRRHAHDPGRKKGPEGSDPSSPKCGTACLTSWYNSPSFSNDHEERHMLNLQSTVKSRRILAVACLVMLLSALTFGQKQAAPVTFEVASVKPAETITGATVLSGKVHLGMSVDGTRLDIGYMSLADLIPIAYGVKPHQVAGPDWMKSQRF